MKKIVVRLFLFLQLLQLCACDAFLDIVPTDKVTSDIVFTNYKNTSAALDGVLEVMSFVQGSPICPAFGMYNALGIHNLIIAGDLMGSEIIPKDYNNDQFQGYDYNFRSRSTDQSRTAFIWKYAYSHINVLNDILENLPNIEATHSQRLQLEGEARFLRAYMYYTLVLYYQHTYLRNPDAPGVPLYDRPGVSGKPRASLRQIYDFIEVDLNFCVNAMDASRRNNLKYYPNVHTAQFLLVRVLVARGEYERAYDIGKDLLAAYPLMDGPTLLKGVNDSNISECVWALPVSEKDAKLSFTLQATYSQKRPYNRRAYAYFYLNDAFVATFDAEDIRKKQICLNSSPSEIQTYPHRKYVSYKLCDSEVSESKTTDIILMRSAEMQLMLAECKARSGKGSEAYDLLYGLQQKRNEQKLRENISQENLLDSIYVERRRELWGEGFALHDIKRFRKPLVRRGNHTFKIAYPIDADEFVFQIPASEIQNNPIDQNL